MNKQNKCIASIWGNDICSHYQVDKTEYCEEHAYLNEYTDDMFDEMGICSKCHLWKYIVGINDGCCVGTCEDCKKYKNPEAKKKIPKCLKSRCKNIGEPEFGGYCGDHESEYVKKCLEEEAKEKGMKLCSNYDKTGCKNLISKEKRNKKCDMCSAKKKPKENYDVVDEDIIVEDDGIFIMKNIVSHEFDELLGGSVHIFFPKKEKVNINFINIRDPNVNKQCPLCKKRRYILEFIDGNEGYKYCNLCRNVGGI